VQVPQLIGLQPVMPGLNVPQLSPAGQDVGQTLVHCVPVELQAVPAAQVPQLMVPPQPSGAVPQIWPVGQLVAGTQTHLLLTQAWFAPVQVPQLMVPPQPSETLPQVSPAGQDAAGVHTHLLPEHVVFGGVVH